MRATSKSRVRRLTIISRQRHWNAEALAPVLVAYVLHRLSETPQPQLPPEPKDEAPAC